MYKTFIYMEQIFFLTQYVDENNLNLLSLFN